MAIKRSIFEIGISVAMVEAFFLYGSQDASRIHDLADIVSSVSGILFGFLLTAIAMLTAMPENRLMLNMKRTGHLQSLLQEMIAGCALHFATLSLSLLAAICEGAASRILLTAALATLVGAIIQTGSAGRKLKFVACALYTAK